LYGLPAVFGSSAAFYDAQHTGLFCGKCRRPGMKPLQQQGRVVAERFAGERLDRIAYDNATAPSVGELRAAALAWIELNSERRLKTPELLETT